MNKFLSELTAFAQAHMGEKIYLVAPTLRVGAQWVEGALKQGRGFVNLHVTTPIGLALNTLIHTLADKNLSIIKKPELEQLIATSWEQVKLGEDEYLKKLPRRPSLFNALARSLSELRMGGVFTSLDEDALEVRIKAKELNALHEALTSKLEQHNLIDHALTFRMATDALLSGESSFEKSAHVLIRSDAELKAVEAEFFSALGEQLTELKVDLPHPRLCPKELFWAESPQAELRNILRKSLSEAKRLDSIEIVHTDYETYVPIIYELLVERFGAGNVPASFAEGLPARYSRPARALVAYSDIMGGTSLAANILRVINEGLLKFDAEFDREKLPLLAAMFRKLKPKGDLTQILDCVNTELDRVKIIDAKRDTATERVMLLGVLSDTLKHIVDICPQNIHEDDGATYSEVLGSGIKFLEQMAYTHGELDEFARERLVLLLSNYIDARARFNDDSTNKPLGAVEFLRELPNSPETRILGSAPRAGFLHISGIEGGGYSSRPNVYFVGMDDLRVSGEARADPVLLDDERAAISDTLSVSSSQNKERLARIWRLLAFQENAFYISYAAASGGVENYPSGIFLKLARTFYDDANMDALDVAEKLGEPKGRLVTEGKQALDMSEWWGALSEGGAIIENASPLLFELYAHIKNANHAATMRSQIEFNEYDGLVPDCGTALDPSASKQILSSHKLETFGTCPRRYFLRYGLGVFEAESLEVDENSWLGALDFGSFLHSLFRIFMTELVEKNERVNYDAHIDIFEKLVVTELQTLADKMPPPSEAALDKTQRDIMSAARIFLRDEEVLQKTYAPLYMEASIGMNSEAEVTDIDTKTPLDIKLMNGKKMRVRGRIDRVDKLDAEKSKGGAYAIWDYKSGRNRFERDNPYRQGRMVQHALYIEMLQEVLKNKFGKGQSVESFGYFFTSARGEGERVVIKPEELGERREIFSLLCDGIASGEFVGTNNPDDCTYCEFGRICATDKKGAELTTEKIFNAEGDLLAGMKKLRGLEGQDE